jgi:signal transduction histidine kinase
MVDAKLDENTASLPPRELEAVYAISRAVARTVDTDVGLDEVVRLARPVFIFDNVVLYLQRDSDAPEPTYARAIGRGRFLEAELTWGEKTGNMAYQTEQVVLRTEELTDAENDRNGVRLFLGLPLRMGGKTIGALVFIRFGGPVYTAEHIHLAEFIADHVAQLLAHKGLVDRVANLEARRRLDELQDDFIATISHELLTPLGFIKGYATTLLRDDTTWDDTTRREFLTIIDEEADRLRELIDNLMDSSRLQAGTLQISIQPLRLETLLRDIALRSTSRNDGLKIGLKIATHGLQVKGDPTRMAQVFDNLLNNASKYAPGSPITISLDVADHFAQIRVTDQGPGIAPEHIESLFRRFYRVPNNNTSVRGTGLGLYICRQIVEAHGGQILVESNLGQGTSFIIRLPLDNGKSDSA